jgi:hypothetical protein
MLYNSRSPLSRRRLLGCAAIAALLSAAGCGDSGGVNQITTPPSDKEGNRSKLSKMLETKPVPSKIKKRGR